MLRAQVVKIHMFHCKLEILAMSGVLQGLSTMCWPLQQTPLGMLQSSESTQIAMWTWEKYGGSETSNVVRHYIEAIDLSQLPEISFWAFGSFWFVHRNPEAARWTTCGVSLQRSTPARHQKEKERFRSGEMKWLNFRFWWCRGPPLTIQIGATHTHTQTPRWTVFLGCFSQFSEPCHPRFHSICCGCQETAILRFLDSSLNKSLWLFVAPWLWIPAYNSQCSQSGSPVWLDWFHLVGVDGWKCETSLKVRSSWRCYQGFSGRKEPVGLDCFEGRLRSESFWPSRTHEPW